MNEFMDDHFARIIENRADKDWTPSLYASPEVVEVYPVIAGLSVIADEDAEPSTIELRAETGDVMASYSGVQLA